MTIAYWCVLAAILLPYVWFGMMNATAAVGRDNDSPRDTVDQLEGMAKRAWWAHLNSFESNTGFVAGVIIAHLSHAPQGRIDLLALAYVGLRVLYGIAYIAGRGALRSSLWGLSLLCVIGLFVIGAL